MRITRLVSGATDRHNIHFIKSCCLTDAPLPKAQGFFIDMSKKKERGVYISDKILQDTNLTMWERVLFAMICNWYESEGERELSQKWLCERFGFVGEKKNNKGNLSRYIKNLIEKGYIEKRAKGVYIPLEVIKTTTNKSYQTDNKKLSKQQPEVIKTITTHLNSNIKEIEEDKNAPLNLENDKGDVAKNATTDHRNLVNDFKPSKEQQMFAVMQDISEAYKNSTMDDQQRKNLSSLFFKIRKHLADLKRNVQKLPSWNVSDMEVVIHFKEFCSNLDEWTINNNFTTKHLFYDYADLRIKGEQRKTTSEPPKSINTGKKFA